MQEMWMQCLGQEDPLEKGMATTPTFLPGKFHMWRSLVGYSPWGCRVRQDLRIYSNNHMLLLLLSHFSHVHSVRSYRQQPTRLLCPWDSLGKNTGVGCQFLLQPYVVYIYKYIRIWCIIALGIIIVASLREHPRVPASSWVHWEMQ